MASVSTEGQRFLCVLYFLCYNPNNINRSTCMLTIESENYGILICMYTFKADHQCHRHTCTLYTQYNRTCIGCEHVCVQSAVCEDLRSGTNASPLYDDEIKGRVDGVREQGQQLHDVKTQVHFCKPVYCLYIKHRKISQYLFLCSA